MVIALAIKTAGIRTPSAARRAGTPATAIDMSVRPGNSCVQSVEQADVEGVDYGWVMQTTFVVTILVGAPVVAVLSAFVTLDSWSARAAFAVRIGAPIWFLTAVSVAAYARHSEAGDGYAASDTEASGETDERDGGEDAAGDDPGRDEA
ncbi:MAG: hypothetical protein A07HR67_02307 [uncultured archaeon A07HR67]|nr:MAG: hypothetical protein A07HR67_02307 [uncultured archaeon A07HR67]